MNAMNKRLTRGELGGRDFGAAHELLLFWFSSPFIDLDYMLNLAPVATAHAPRFLLRHPTAARRGRHCRAKPRHQTHSHAHDAKQAPRSPPLSCTS